MGFASDSYEAEQLLKDVDIHSVTGILRLYLRELPEALFTDQLYPQLLEAFNRTPNNLIKRTELLKECFEKLPTPNKESIKYILDHLMRWVDRVCVGIEYFASIFFQKVSLY